MHLAQKIPQNSSFSSSFSPMRKIKEFYTPFGVGLKNRDFSSEKYRYGFQNQERDDEMKGEGNSVNFTYRMHDTRLGRFFAVDPLLAKYPHYSPYQFSGNRLIDHIELEGLEEAVPHIEFRMDPYGDLDKAIELMQRVNELFKQHQNSNPELPDSENTQFNIDLKILYEEFEIRPIPTSIYIIFELPNPDGPPLIDPNTKEPLKIAPILPEDKEPLPDIIDENLEITKEAPSQENKNIESIIKAEVLPIKKIDE